MADLSTPIEELFMKKMQGQLEVDFFTDDCTGVKFDSFAITQTETGLVLKFSWRGRTIFTRSLTMTMGVPLNFEGISGVLLIETSSK